MKDHVDGSIANESSRIDGLMSNHMTHEQHELLWVHGLPDVVDIIQDTASQ